MDWQPGPGKLVAPGENSEPSRARFPHPQRADDTNTSRGCLDVNDPVPAVHPEQCLVLSRCVTWAFYLTSLGLRFLT